MSSEEMDSKDEERNEDRIEDDKKDDENKNGDDRNVTKQNRNANSNEDSTNSVEFVDSSPDVIDKLRNIATTGTVENWTHLQSLLTQRLDKVLDHYIHRSGKNHEDEEYQEPNVEKFELENYRKEIVSLITSFNEPPFTIQRICELLHTPFVYYDKISTFLRGLEKTLRVS